MKRVMCLYRVSTKGQVDPQDDIPMQRRECMDFISRQLGWKFVGELMEKGVSGYKISASKRDAILEMRAKAERKEFDVLLVFMFDRLGRREDETPFLVQWFVEHGIEVWSTREGQQRIDNRADKLINYIRYWQAGGESEKTSMRVKAAHSQMTADGIWRGGACPFGYKLVHHGRTGKKNRPLYDLEIDEHNGPIVQEIFEMAINQDCGALRIANYLNRKYPDENKVWTRPTVMTILKNVTYTGRMHMNDVLSAPIEGLRLISDEDFDFVKHALEKRIPHRYDARREQENQSVEDGQTKTAVFGASLLSGLVYCGHCGCKLVGSYCVKNRKNHSYFRPIYRCFNGGINAKHCDGQTVYSAKRIEAEVNNVVHQYFDSICSTKATVWQDQARRQKKSKTTDTIVDLEAELEDLHAQKRALEKEIIKSIMGESAYTDAKKLNSIMHNLDDKIDEGERNLAKFRKEREEESSHLHFLANQYENIRQWADVFDNAELEEQKMILARLIERIEVTRDYYITVKFFVALDEFLKSTTSDKITVEEAENTYLSIAL